MDKEDSHPSTFDEAIEIATAHVMAAHEVLAPFLSPLSDSERVRLPPVPLRFPDAARAMVQAADGLPLLASVSGWDPQMVAARVEEAGLLAPLVNQAEGLVRAAEDTRRAWLVQAYGSALSLYRVGQALAEDEPTFQAVIRPLADVYAQRKKSAAASDEPEEADERSASGEGDHRSSG